jgi:hypothetical protein
MKGVPCALVLFLLVLAVLAAGCFQTDEEIKQAIKSDDPLVMSVATAMVQVKNPGISFCYSPTYQIIEQLTNPGNPKDIDHCVQFFAVQLGDTTQCWRINRGAPMTKCFLLIASKKNDVGICDQIPQTSDMQAYLPLDCQWEVAIKNNNQAACNAMGSHKISRMFIGEMSKQTCLARLASGQGVGESTT